MKKNGWMILSVTMLAVALVVRADGQTGAAPASEKPATTKPAAAGEKAIVLSPGAATVAGKNVNVRGKAGFKGEVFTKLQNGDAVNVIEQVILLKPKAGEPSTWAKISYPTNAYVWVHGSYLNADKTVKPKKLNIRTGAGENYSIVGTLEQGVAVKEVSTKGNWTQIEAPADAIAFVAASYVRQDATSDMAPPVVSVQQPAPETTTIGSDPIIASTTTDLANTNPPVEPNPTIADSANVPPPVIEEVWVPRTVTHEGIVKATVSIQAPTKYGLHAVDSGKLINYLYSPTAELEMSRYAGKHIIVGGQEGLDERWVNTPVLTIQKIYVVR